MRAALADIRIEGTRDSLRISTGQEPVGDVLSALARSYGIKYRSSIPLDAAASHSYSGSLIEVTSRLLEPYSYVLKRNQDETEVIVVGKRGAAPAPPIQSTATKDKGVTSRWR